MINYKSIFTILFCFFYYHIYFCQSSEQLKIEQLLKLSDSFKRRNDLKAIKFSKEASKIAEKINDSKKKVVCYLSLAECLDNVSLYKESLIYAEKALKEPVAKESKILRSQIYEIKASSYYSLDLLDQAISSYNKINDVLENDELTEAKIIRIRSHIMLSSIYLYKMNYKEVKKNIDTAQRIIDQLPVKEKKFEMRGLYGILGYYYLDQNKKDSSLIYFKKSLEEAGKRKSASRYAELHALGDFYYSTKEYEKSLNFYIATLNDLKLYSGTDDDYVAQTTKSIADIYAKLGKEDKEKLYLEKFYRQIQKNELRRKQDIQLASSLILQENNFEKESLSTKNKKLFIIVVSVFIILTSLFLGRYYYLKKKTNDLFVSSKQELEFKEEIIVEQKEVTKLLEKKINNAFTEVIELAKSNDPEFYARFREVYPEFTDALLHLNPKLRVSELTLSALIFLGFNSKDISNIMNRSLSTISNRKYNLRKKLNIEKDYTLEIWFENLKKTNSTYT